MEDAPIIEGSFRRHVLEGELPVYTANMAGAEDRFCHATYRLGEYGALSSNFISDGCVALGVE